MVTIKDVAREAGVAVSTVSKYLNGGNVRQENREQIEQAVNKLGYEVNHYARVMRSGSSKMVLVMVTQFEDGYCCEVMQRAREALLKVGYIAVVAETRGDRKKEQEILKNAIIHDVEGVITLHSDRSLPEYNELLRRSIPTVIVGRANRKRLAGCVYFDDAEVFADIFRRLRALGHLCIGVVGGGIDKARMHSSEFAYYLGLFKKAGLNINDDYLFVSESGNVQSGMQAVNYFMQLQQPPTAIVCLNADLLLGVQLGLREMKINVPEDMSLCALIRKAEEKLVYINDVEVVIQPVGDAAEKAVGLLLESIRLVSEKKIPTHTTVQLRAELKKGKTLGRVKNGKSPA